MNNPYLLKKQLQDNEEELSKYLRDMNIWQETMKRKEQCPPIQKSDEKKKQKTEHPSKPSKTKISSWDYTAWDKFDVDKACKEVDVDAQNEPEKNDSVEYSNNVTPSNVSEAIHEKNLGNALVQKQKWAEAILRYTRAIEHYNKDPVFFANRALCYLKTKEYKLAIKDCTSSLQLDSSYVKSYQRRSAAHIALGMYNKAKEDLNKVLKLESNNRQAKVDLDFVNKKINQDAASKITDNKPLISNSVNSPRSTNSNVLLKNFEEPTSSVVPEWPSRIGCKEVISIRKLPHLRSKKPFCTPKIKEAQEDQGKLDDLYLLQTTLQELCGKKKKEKQPVNKEIIVETKPVKKEIKQCLVVPPPPQTYVQLKQDWAYLQNDSKQLFQYLKQIPGQRLPSIVRNSMDNDLFVDILRILKTEFIPSGHEIIDYMIGISELPRLQMLVMFCSDIEVSYIKELLNQVSKSAPENVFKSLKSAFGVI